MFFYLTFFLFTILLSINYPLKINFNNLNKKIAFNYDPFLFSFLFLSLVLGFRYNVGIDYMNYVNNFKSYQSGIKPRNIEIGYELINHLIAFSGFDFWLVFLIFSFIINYFTLKTLKDNSKNYLLSTIIIFGTGFIFFQTNGIRQAIAIACIFYGSKYIISSDLKKYLFFCTLGLGFHLTAYIMIPFYWLAKIKFKKIILLLGVLISLILFINPLILEKFTEALLNLITIPRYQNYIKKALANSGGIDSGYRVIFEALISIIIIIFTPQKIFDKLQGRIYINFFVFSNISKLLFSRFWALGRISFYFTVFQSLFFPYFIYNIPVNKKSKVLLIILTIIYFSFWTFWAIKGNSHDIIPYQFVFWRIN